MKNTISEPYRITEKDWSKFKDFIIRSRTDIPYAYGDGLEKVMQQPDLYWIEGIKNKQVFVIDNEEKFVSGVVLSKDDDGIWSIKSLWTEPTYRGKGLALKLLDCVIDTAKKSGVKVIELGVNIKLKAAITLYKSIGFKEIERLNDIDMGDGSKNNLLIMRLELE